MFFFRPQPENPESILSLISSLHGHQIKESVTNISGDVLFFMMFLFRPQPEHSQSCLKSFFCFCHKKCTVANDGNEPGIELTETNQPEVHEGDVEGRIDRTETNQTEVHKGDVEGRIDRIHGIQLIHFTGAQLAPITFGVVVSVFMSLLLSSLSLLCSKFIIFIYYK